jgi:hypothetical protein
MDYTFTELTPSDVVPLKDLLRVFGEAFEDVETYQGAVPRTTICSRSSPCRTLSSSSHAMAVR